MSDPVFDVEGRVVVVTGGAGLLGRSMCAALAARGARVAVVDVADPGPADAENVGWFPGDVTSRASLADARDRIVSRWGEPWGLVNNAALDSPPDAPVEENGPFETYPEASWDRVMSVNAKGVFLCCQVFGGGMALAGRGTIVNVASIYGLVSPDQRIYEYRRAGSEAPFYKPVAYAASKSALFNLTRYLATYWAARGVRVNTLTLAGVYNGQDDAFLRGYVPKVPLGRMATPLDYVGPVIFLLTDASTYMTGSNLVVDGGFTAW